MKRLTTGIFLFFVMAACSPTRLTSSWTTENITAGEYNKILVLGLINEPDRTIREEMEKHMVTDLVGLGYKAVCSCDEFDPKAFEKMSEEQALEKLSGSGIDAVLTIVLLDKEKERYYVPGRVYYSPFVIYYNRFYGYYTTMYNRVYTPGYYQTGTNYFWESNFYTLNDRHLLYSAQSQSFDPGSALMLSQTYSAMIVKDMLKRSVLSPKKD